MYNSGELSRLGIEHVIVIAIRRKLTPQTKKLHVIIMMTIFGNAYFKWNPACLNWFRNQVQVPGQNSTSARLKFSMSSPYFGSPDLRQPKIKQ